MKRPVEPPPERLWSDLLRLALEEDLGPGDVTTPLVVDAFRRGAAVIEAREPLVVCGLAVAEAVFHRLDPALRFEPLAGDGADAEPGAVLARLHGRLAPLLAGERTALNFLMRLCGVATTTRRFVRAVVGTRAEIVDTRKTLPGWRVLDKYATAVGGATNHRVGLFDGILLKDNHVAAAGGVALAVKTAKAAAPPGLRLQVEVESAQDAVAAVEAGADFLLLDNRTPAEVREIVARIGGRALLEVSGGIDLTNVREMAETGVARISIGALTHSARAADVALEIARDDLETHRGGAAR
jgi:nicotinate-nucleotide pyrophosphorylase (carboxylating)